MLVAGYLGSLRTPMYVFIVEFPQPVGTRNTSYTQVMWKLRDQSREGVPVYLDTFKNSRTVGQGTVHVSSYCRHPAIRARKAHPFTWLAFKTSDPGARHSSCKQLLRELPQSGHARHNHLLSFEN
jgi:hypothetical protein